MFKTIFAPVVAVWQIFVPPKPTVVSCVEQDYYKAQLDRLHAEKQLEYWTAIVPMMKAREARLRRMLNSKNIADTPAGPIPEDQGSMSAALIV
jgi:hypothetical protein